jgi:hypothetical protein
MEKLVSFRGVLSLPCGFSELPVEPGIPLYAEVDFLAAGRVFDLEDIADLRLPGRLTQDSGNRR